jgi:hypothetical protein
MLPVFTALAFKETFHPLFADKATSCEVSFARRTFYVILASNRAATEAFWITFDVV